MMSGSVRWLVLGVLAALIVAAPAAAGGGTSSAAHSCQQGGWQTLKRTDGSGFRNTGECVSYAAQGGQFQKVTIGSFANSDGGGTVLWSCIGVYIYGSGFSTGVTGVEFGGVAASQFSIFSDTEIYAVTPANLPGSGYITLSGSSGVVATSPSPFTSNGGSCGSV